MTLEADHRLGTSKHVDRTVSRGRANILTASSGVQPPCVKPKQVFLPILLGPIGILFEARSSRLSVKVKLHDF